ncbi:SDR family oxidoreductase [Paracoccus aminophilus]|uniref:NAD-dependent epimerase/dehydratase n=1 Tax=Paracoccus aminophilus JCM 7686 TaxID=1367847 RepID=S5Y0B7_PARAH|nr:SDR family oxidoreductase [Paracoccus aminophilus]AGT10977.1 NAD-dependent epimerase/dehydratase [Paracoccus aminophilus JCM 7686]
MEEQIMRIFVTGATGFLGQHVVAELRAAGHQVLGLTRSEAGADQLRAQGAAVQLQGIDARTDFREAVADCDAVIHLAFDHNFARFKENCETDRQIITNLGAALRGTAKPLLITSTTMVAARRAEGPVTEDDPALSSDFAPRAASEEAGAAVLAQGVNISVMRLPQVHDRDRQGLVSDLIAHAARLGVSAYVGAGANPWCAAHVSDVARLYRLAIEAGQPGARYHAVAESAIPFREIAEAIGAKLGLPVEPLSPEEGAAHFGWLQHFATRDASSSSAQTRARLGWQPVGPGLIDDLL